MSDIGDALRAFAAQCDGIPELCGVIFAKSGDLTIHLGQANPRLADRDSLKGLLIAAKHAADHGTLKAATPEQLLRIETVLGNG
jgi:hypothetical protein